MRRALKLAAAAALIYALNACGTLGYYGHLLGGQYRLMHARQPISSVLADGAADPELRRRLELVQEARRFAVTSLALPDNGSYTLYADLGRPYAVWNVFAAPEFSLEAHEWCQPFLGCLAYRGYYDESRAEKEASVLKAQGLDVFVGGVAAYSTLGWFDDPVLNTMLGWPDDELIETLFHELAHQVEFIGGDTAFNESFASFVGEEGLRAFRAARGEPPPDPLEQQRRDQFIGILFKTRERLEALYASGQQADTMRAAKQAEFSWLRENYARLRESWGGYAGYDRWFEGEINNAKLLPIGLYQRWLPAFAALFEQAGKQWPRFYELVKELGRLAPQERDERLRELTAVVDPPAPS